MIESIYSKENGKLKEWSKANVMFRMPKNIRQIGKISGNKKVYVEDYVITFVKQLVKRESEEESLAVLLGQYIKIDNSKNIFISGAVKIRIPRVEDVSAFTNEMWTSIYEDIKKYFTDIEIVGWFYTKAGSGLEINEQITKVHLDNFAGQDKTLLIYDSTEDDEAFYVYDSDKLSRMQGYYIYYEKNEEMQCYMIETNKEENGSTENEYDDKTTRDIRNILASKQELKEESAAAEEPKQENKKRRGREIKGKVGQGRNVHFLYGVSTLLAVTVLVIGAAILDNYDKMRNVEEALGVISENIVGSEDGKKEDGKAPEQDGERKDKLTEVETVSGELDTKEGTDSKTDPAAEENADAVNETNTSNTDNQTEENDSEKDTAESTMQEFENTTDNMNETANADDKNSNNTPSNTDTTSDKTSENSNDKKEETQENVSKAETNNTEKTDETKETLSETRYYIVKEGDTLAGISLKIYKNVDGVKTIQDANELMNKDKIMVGQKLIIP